MSDYARVLCKIWVNDDFIKLDARAQQVYLLLLSYPTRNLTGILPLTMRRWANSTADATPENVQQALLQLVQSDFIVVDWNSEEVLVRTYIRNSEVYRQPNSMRSALKSAVNAVSPIIRAAVADELLRLPVHRDDQETRAIAKALIGVSPEGFPEGFRDGFPEGFPEDIPDDIREVPVYGNESSNDPNNHKPVTITDNNVIPDTRRGTRLPPDWSPDDAVKQDLRGKYPDLMLGSILEEFIDYWCSVPGSKGTKLDWNRTFRNRVREVAHLPRYQRHPRQATATADLRVLQGQELKAQFQQRKLELEQ